MTLWHPAAIRTSALIAVRFFVLLPVPSTSRRMQHRFALGCKRPNFAELQKIDSFRASSGRIARGSSISVSRKQ